jgi:hypothetical protein
MRSVILGVVGVVSLVLNVFLVPLVFAAALDLRDAGVVPEGIRGVAPFIAIFVASFFISLIETFLLRLPAIVLRYDTGSVLSGDWLELSVVEARSGAVRVFPTAVSLVFPSLVFWLGFRGWESEWVGLATSVILYLVSTIGAMLGMRLHCHVEGLREPTCPKCGYVLYYAQGHRCPECHRWFWTHEISMQKAEWKDGVLQPKDKREGGLPAQQDAKS